MIKLPTKYLKLHIEGESHSPQIKIDLKGYFKGNKYDPYLLDDFINKRKATKFYETRRVDSDLITIKKGVRQNKLLNHLVITVKNDNISLSNYKLFDSLPRPGHGDFARIKKYGSMLVKGTDIYSGRMTIGYVIAGAITKMTLPYITVTSEIVKVGKCTDNNQFINTIKQSFENGDSLSAVIKTTIKGVPPGIGSHDYFTFDSLLSSLLFKIPGIKSLSFGNNFDNLEFSGSEFNDVIINSSGTTKTNHCGGILSGLSNGNEIVFYTFARPASSIKLPQKTFNLTTNKMDQLQIKGSHDSFYQERLLVVIDSICYITVYDLLQQNKRSMKK